MSVTKRTKQRVFVSGVGMVTPLGANREQTWDRLCQGDRGLGWLESDDPNFLPSSAGGLVPFLEQLGPRLLAMGRGDLLPLLTEPTNTFALGATIDALQHANLRLENLATQRVGCVVGTSKGGVRSIYQDGITHPDLFAITPNAAALTVQSYLGSQGPCLAPVLACATGLAAIIRGALLIENGECDVVIAGSSDASLTPAILASFRRLGVLAEGFCLRGGSVRRKNHRPKSGEEIRGLAGQSTFDRADPRFAVAPFDQQRTGFLVGEGAGIVVLESESHVNRRGGVPLAAWQAAGMSSDAAGLTQLDSNPTSLVRLIQDVCGKANLLDGQDLGYINLHGTGTQINDRCEADAIQRVFQSATRSIPCSSIKGSIGHLLGAAASVEFGCTVLAIRDQVVPPNVNLETPFEGCRLNLVRDTAVPGPVNFALKLSLGFGGHLCAAVIKKVDCISS